MMIVKKIRFITILLGLLLLAGVGRAQNLAVQVCPAISNGAGNQLVYTTTCSNPNTAGNAIVIAEVGTIASIADTNGDTFQQGVSTHQLGFWYALNGVGGTGLNTITITLAQPGAIQAVPAEYAGVIGVTVSPIANGSGTSPLSFSLPAAVGNIVLGFGSQWTNSTQAPFASGTGFAFDKAGPVWLEDSPVTIAGSVTSSATYISPVNWYVGVAVLNTTPPPPPVFTTVTVTTQVLQCTVCDGSDDAPFTGILSVTQASNSQGFAFNSDGTISAKAAILTSVDPADFTFSFLNASGVALPGGEFEWKIPQVVLQSVPGMTIGTLAVPPFRISSGIDKNGNPAILFMGFVTVSQ